MTTTVKRMVCRGCGASGVMTVTGREFTCEITHGDLCPFLRRAKQDGVADMDWMTVETVPKPDARQ